MLSTLMTYRLYTDDAARAKARTLADSTIARDTQYYRETIASVKTVDDLLVNDRLYRYAMKAYGLEDQIASKGLMRKVLESDLSDRNSFANKLVDQRYAQFAKAFDFSAASAAAPAAVTTRQVDAIVEAYDERTLRNAGTVSAKVASYKSLVETVRTVDDLLANPVGFEVVARAAGLEPGNASRAVLRGVLTGTEPALRTNETFRKLLASFEFGPDGTVASGRTAQGAPQSAVTLRAYLEQSGNAASPAAARLKVESYERTLPTVNSVGQLTYDTDIRELMLTSVGIDPRYELASHVTSVLKSDLADPASYANKLSEATPELKAKKEKYLKLAASFNFNEEGTAPPGMPAQTAAQAKGTVDGYLANYGSIGAASATVETAIFKGRIARVETLDQLLYSSSAGTLRYALKAFDLDPATESIAKLRKVLTSDLSDPTSYANTLKDERYVNLASAFNFGADGTLAPSRTIQTQAGWQDTVKRAVERAGDDLADFAKEQLSAGGKRYIEAVQEIVSLDGFLETAAVRDYAVKAFGLDDLALSQADLRKILTSDLGDERSFANSFGDRDVVAFAKAFRFQPDGTVLREAPAVQSGAAILETETLFLRGQMEAQAGQQSEGARLALYFARKAPDIGSAFDILADRALLEVVKTSLSLPDAFSNLDIDVQAKILESRFDFESLDTVDGLAAFIQRYTTLYDMKNSTGDSTLSALFSGSSGSGSSLLGFL